MSNIVNLKIVTCPICESKVTAYKKVGNYFCKKCNNYVTIYNLDEYTDKEITEIYNMYEKTRLTLEECGFYIDEVELIEMTLDVFDKERIK